LARDSVDESAEQEIWNNGQRDSDHDRSGEVNTMKDYELIDSIEDRRDEKYLAYMVPGFAQQTTAVLRRGNNCPPIWFPVFSRVTQSRSYRKESGYRGLKEQSQLHWPAGTADEVFPKMSEGFSHCITLLWLH
jgi:hypothetical protein